MTNKDIALQYLNKGFSVIPLVSPPMISGNMTEEEIIKKCKRALVKWTKFQDQRPTQDEVNAWWDKWPDANIGIMTGKISNLVVFDVDKNDATEYAEEEGGFPITVKATTGKGYHVYVQYPDFEVRNSTNIELGMDTLFFFSVLMMVGQSCVTVLTADSVDLILRHSTSS